MATRYNFDATTVAGRVILQRARNAYSEPPVWENWLSIQASAILQFEPVIQNTTVSNEAGKFIIRDIGAPIVELVISKKEHLYKNAIANAQPVSKFADNLMTTVFTATSGGGGGGGGDASASLQVAQLAEANYQTNLQNVIYEGVGSPADAMELDPNENASLVALSKGSLENLGLVQAVLGYGGSPTVLDPELGGTISGVLKGLLSVAGLSIGQKIDLELLPDVTIVHKSGKNFDVDTGTLPESVWNGGGSYTGFPITHTGTVQAVSSSASDVGVLTVLCLETENSTEYTSKTIPVNGTVPQTAPTPFEVYRIHSASYSSNTSTGTQLNAGTIVVRSSANPLIVFLAMPIGRNQSYMSGYTIPKGKKGLILPATWRAGGTAGSQIEGVMFIRPKGGAPRYRRNCTATVGTPVTDKYDGFIVATEGTDIMPTVDLATANNLTAEASYDIIIIPITP